ncbi:MBL fold metallo-hydrolase [uncultured Paracoccus sp.]|uniref:MBL fold metallo-hydrolase n=1 Tax=uncultured Paracoccus sp. TaxID=189685 RepID=UPI002633F0AA|nr:MBL fold metallo-hydrolase [uncultured Paracoccus sp.]
MKERVVLAPNPSALTGPGTNSFLLGTREMAVIDPGPDIPGHLDAIMAAAAEAGGRITHILVTHAHLDHSPGARRLARMTGAPVLGFGPAAAGRSATMARLAGQGLQGGEGVDHDFAPDITLADGAVVEGPDWRLTAIHTPGHMGNHLSFQADDTIYCGDVVMGWSTTLISPPDGDLADYFRTLDRLAATGATRLRPAHGDAVEAVAPRLAELAAHRRARTGQILAALRDRPGSAADLAARIYDVAPGLMPAATRNVLAHLLALQDLGAVLPLGALHSDVRWQHG